MSVCCHQINRDITLSPRSLEILHRYNITKISLFINKITMDAIIKYILSDVCNASVIGYEKSTNKYWCKIYKEKICQLHIEVEILNKGPTKSEALICPLYGTSTSIENFVSDFKESIELYRTSSFIRACWETNLLL